MHLVVGDIPLDNKAHVVKVLGQGLRTCVHRGQCACVLSIHVVLCNSKKKFPILSLNIYHFMYYKIEGVYH